MRNNDRCCAERRLISRLDREAIKHGVPASKRAHWIRRKHGSCMVVWRENSGCSVPCVLCKPSIEALQLTVIVARADGTQFVGRLSDVDAPASKPTSGQSHRFGFR
jgi:hypothetical protein